MSLNRRSFVKFLGVSPTLISPFSFPVASFAQPSSSVASAPERSDHAVELPFRHIHLDFHTSPAITGVGEDFTPDGFGRTLKDASINSITVFAKCHHGMAYYPTKVGIQHPNLKIDLLGGMIEGCHKYGVLVVAYISTMYDQYMWRHHGDWRVLDENGDEVGLGRSAGPMKVELGRVCLNSPMVDYLAAQAEEVLKNYDVDGVWYDNMSYPAGAAAAPLACWIARRLVSIPPSLRTAPSTRKSSWNGP